MQVPVAASGAPPSCSSSTIPSAPCFFDLSRDVLAFLPLCLPPVLATLDPTISTPGAVLALASRTGSRASFYAAGSSGHVRAARGIQDRRPV